MERTYRDFSDINLIALQEESIRCKANRHRVTERPDTDPEVALSCKNVQANPRDQVSEHRQQARGGVRAGVLRPGGEDALPGSARSCYPSQVHAPPTTPTAASTFSVDTVWAPTRVLPDDAWPRDKAPSQLRRCHLLRLRLQSSSCDGHLGRHLPGRSSHAGPRAPLPPMRLCARAPARGPAPSPALRCLYLWRLPLGVLKLSFVHFVESTI